MRTLALALAFALTSLAGAAHAAPPKGIVAPAPGTLKRYLSNAKGTPIKKSVAHNSQYYKLTKALADDPKGFRKIKLTKALDMTRVALIPKSPIKGLQGNTAYIKASLLNRVALSKVRLPRF